MFQSIDLCITFQSNKVFFSFSMILKLLIWIETWNVNIIWKKINKFINQRRYRPHFSLSKCCKQKRRYVRAFPICFPFFDDWLWYERSVDVREDNSNDNDNNNNGNLASQRGSLSVLSIFFKRILHLSTLWYIYIYVHISPWYFLKIAFQRVKGSQEELQWF